MASSMLVAAIDFGTTYSGWAYSFEHQHKQNPSKVYAKVWSSGKLVSEKAPTTVLIEPDGKTFIAFGYEAEDKYAELAQKGQHRKWFYFRRIKMLLMDKVGLGHGLEVKDETGKTLSAKTVVSMVIKYLKNDLLKECAAHFAGILEAEEIMWVLTVPAIWKDSAKQFVRGAAVEAGINTGKLKLALEPECASLYCRLIPIKRKTARTDICNMKAGTKYMILDVGGGTSDITVHQILEEGRLKEIDKASGGPWGGSKVEDAFFKLLSSIVGDSVFQTFVSNHMDDYLDLVREFEIKKRRFDPVTDLTESETDRLHLVFTFPLSLKKTFEAETGKTLVEAIAKTTFSRQIELTRDKLRLDARLMSSFFEEATRNIVDHVKMLFTKPAVMDVSEILMVGGFSESKMLQHAIKNEFGSKTIIVVPHDAGLVVLKGAVVFGHNTGAISERIAKYTYGVAISKRFIEGEHDERYRYITENGIARCDNIFGKHVEIGQSLKYDETYQREYRPADSKATSCMAQLYVTMKQNPKYVTDDGCFKIGEMSVAVESTVPYEERYFIVSLSFGDTEIHIHALEKSTGRKTKCSLNFLE